MSCNGCRVLRKGCSESCLLRPCLASVEGADAQGHATLFLAKFFGRAGLMGFIAAVNESQRPALFQSLLYEACGRTINPVYGSAGLLWSGQWQLCEAAVESVLKGGTPSSCFTNGSAPTLSTSPSPLRQCPSPLPPCSTPSPPQQNMINTMTVNRSPPQGNPMAAFPFPMMDPTGMAYLPLAMAPMTNTMNHMATMGGATSTANYQQSYQNASCPMQVPSYLTTNNTMPCNMMGPQSISHMQNNASQMWVSEAMVGQQAAAAARPQGGVYPHALGGSSSPVSDSGSVVDSLSGMHCSSPPLVAPVARRLTAAQTSGFMPTTSHTTVQYNTSTRSAGGMLSGGTLRGDNIGLYMPEWATRAAADPAAHSALLPLSL